MKAWKEKLLVCVGLVAGCTFFSGCAVIVFRSPPKHLEGEHDFSVHVSSNWNMDIESQGEIEVQGEAGEYFLLVHENGDILEGQPENQYEDGVYEGVVYLDRGEFPAGRFFVENGDVDLIIESEGPKTLDLSRAKEANQADLQTLIYLSVVLSIVLVWIYLRES